MRGSVEGLWDAEGEARAEAEVSSGRGATLVSSDRESSEKELRKW